MTPNTRIKALKKAIKLAGGQVRVAETLQIKQSAVSNWVTRKRLSAERAVDLERLSGVSRCDLRPDLFPRSAA